MKNKIINLNNLSKKISELKKKGKKVVLCHGVFDLLHLGHVKHFNEARKFGDILVVTITPNKYVSKGPNRPVFDSAQRMEVIASLECVDFVSENKWSDAVETIKILKPNIYCKGPDYKKNKDDLTQKIYEESKAINQVKGSIKYTSAITYSSSKILNSNLDIFNKEQKKMILKVKSKIEFTQIKKEVEKLRKLKVLVIGETIIDQYLFCEALGKSGKDPVMMFHHKKLEQYLGGAGAIANNISSFCDNISLLTMIGEKQEYLNFIKKNLEKNIKLKFIKKKNSPTIIKKKFIDLLSKNKLFGTYEIDDENLNHVQENQLNKILLNSLKKFDLVILSDYGHGFITENIAKTICRKSKFLVLNSQLNAANYGHHNINKFNKSNCIIINESELRHELRNKNAKLQNLIPKISKNLRAKFVVVTRGSQGVMMYEKKTGEFISCPAFAGKIIDKIGAGDSLMSLLSPLLKQKLNKDLILFMSSLAGAHSVETMGNSKRIDKLKILKASQYILK